MGKVLRIVNLNYYNNNRSSFPDSHYEFAGYSEFGHNGVPKQIELYYYPKGR